MKIAILYIATKRYKELWPLFFDSCEKYFLPNQEKKYFIFTDDITQFTGNKVKIISIVDSPNWFDVSLSRFDYFLQCEKELLDYDYTFFFNANTIFQSIVLEDKVIPTLENDYLIGSSMYKLSKAYYPKCPQKSSCYIPEEKKKDRFYIGSFIGGRSKEFLNVCEKCSLMIAEDRRRNLIPDTYDEYYYNKALMDKNPLLVTIVGVGKLAKSPILFYDKRDVLGTDYIKNLKQNSLWLQLKKLYQGKYE